MLAKHKLKVQFEKYFAIYLKEDLINFTKKNKTISRRCQYYLILITLVIPGNILWPILYIPESGYLPNYHQNSIHLPSFERLFHKSQYSL